MQRTPPIPVEEVRTLINDAIRNLDWRESRDILVDMAEKASEYIRSHVEMEHSIPGPSSAEDCIRKLWGKKNGIEFDTQLPLHWTMRQIMGTLNEQWWHIILNAADPRLKAEEVLAPIDLGYGVGSPDRRLVNLNSLAEFKSKTGWAYRYIMQDGVRKQEPGEFAQVQQYMYGDGKDWTLYLASVSDPSFFANIFSKSFPKWLYVASKEELQEKFYYVEWIPLDAEYARRSIQRCTDMIPLLLDSETMPKADYDAPNTQWPCQLGCPMLKTCEAAGPHAQPYIRRVAA